MICIEFPADMDPIGALQPGAGILLVAQLMQEVSIALTNVFVQSS